MKTLFLCLLTTLVVGCNLLGTPTRSVENETDLEEDSCSDGLQNGTESDFDCGGSCRPCANGRSCFGGSDCDSGICENEICVSEKSTCINGVLDDDEIDVDCGGLCEPCPSSWWHPQWDSRQRVDFDVFQDTINSRLLITLPETSNIVASHVRFVQDGQVLASEIDEDKTLSFWVLFPDLHIGNNALYVYTDSSDPSLSQPNSPWGNSIAVYHSPHIIDVQGNLSIPIPSGNISTALKTTGFVNSATRFDGNTAIVISDPERQMDALFPTVSISAWIKPTNITKSWQMVVARQFSNSFGDDFAMGLNFGILRGCLNKICTKGNVAPPINEWSHIAFVYDEGSSKIYFNGELQSDEIMPRSKTLDTHVLMIGGDRNGPNDAIEEIFNGTIDEVRISPKALLPNTLLTQFQSHTNGFSFDESETQPD